MSSFNKIIKGFKRKRMQIIKKQNLLFGLLVLLTGSVYAQQTIPDSADGVVYKGVFESVARGIIDGNLIETNFRNHGELSRWNDIPWGVWPRGVGGRHIDGVGVVVAGYVDAASPSRTPTFQDYLEWSRIGGAIPDTTLNPVIINYRQAGARTSPYNGDLWGWLPLPGFNNPFRLDPVTLTASAVPALSNDLESWPQFWPDRLGEEDSGWPGTWNGRDGRFPSSDLESYYVMDDFSDLEYAAGIEIDGPHSEFGVYYPSPESDSLMGGFGLQTQVRLFQWANILAEDTMFLIYRITNKGDNAQERLYFAQIVDYGLGNEEDDDNASYDPLLDVVYGWDSNGIGTPSTAGQSSYELGYTGFAFLESPANDNNMIDDDLDGITDESRFDENYLVFTTLADIQNYTATQYDLTAFETFHGEPVEDRPAAKALNWFTTDENLDWVGFLDSNGNGVWDAGEVLNNDVGRDGLGPFDQNYPGPDEGQGDGLPTNGEPNYNELDVDESDQIGLTGFDLNTRPFYESGDNLRDDTWLFARIDLALFPDPNVQPPVDPVADDEPFILFISGQVELASDDDPTGKSTDFFSTAWIFGNDEEDFFKNRRTVQNIYNSDYNFAQPPIIPTLKAVAGDGQVFLSWDTVSVRSFDRFLQDFDFEGYRLYRGTNNIFTDARSITDVNGTPTFYEPLVQYDLDNDISGTVGVLENTAYYDLGSNTGLKFFHVDDDVINGKSYYYAIVAYDRGIPAAEGSDVPGIDPQENTFRVAVNSSGLVTGTSINAAFVTPTTPPAGYVQGGATVDLSSVTEGSGTGYADVNVVVESDLIDNLVYEVSFSDSNSSNGEFRVTTTYSIRELTENVELVTSSPFATTTSIVNGFTVSFTNAEPGNIIDTKTGWIANEGTENVMYGLEAANLDGLTTDWSITVANNDDGSSENFVRTDSDYELLFVNPSDSTYRPPRLLGAGFTRIELPLFARNINSGEQADLFIRDLDSSGDISQGDQLFVAEPDSLNRQKYRFSLTIESGTTAPAVGEKIRISTTRAFGSDDSFQFGVSKGSVDTDLAKSELDDIYVAPNPYVGAASWERAGAAVGRGERKINFFNLPRTCTIRIFNIRGELLKSIEHQGAFNEGSASWDLQTDSGEDIAYGVYFYHVSAPGIGEYIDKFAVVK
ncbi:MAG: hypothetical protein BalsKO_31550 [Balneolaceae bacterium]